MSRELLFSCPREDFEIQFMRAGGKGGQHQNTTDSAVRILHKPSGAVGESRSEKSQHTNRKLAMQRLVQTPKWRIWLARRRSEIATGETAEQRVDRMMAPHNLRIEARKDGIWVEYKEDV